MDKVTQTLIKISHIVKRNGRFIIFSKDGAKKLGSFLTYKQALKRLRQIEYFKHRN